MGEIIPFDPNQMPAHIAQRFQTKESNVLQVGLTVPSLTFKGKVWHVNLGSQQIPLVQKVDGDEVPVPTVSMIVLDYAKQRGRMYRPGAYDDNDPKAPVCWSDDGIAPPADVTDRQSEKCTTCPMAAKGSQVSDANKPTTACRESRVLAVRLLKQGAFIPKVPTLRLRLPVTSDYDNQSKALQEKGLFAFQNFLQFLKQRSIVRVESVVVKASFDSSVAYPKLLFRADGWVPDDLADAIEAAQAEPELKEIMGASVVDMPEGGRAARLPSPDKPETETKKAETKPRTTKKADKPADPPPPPAAPEEDEDEKALRLLQEKMAAKKKANGGTPEPAPAEASGGIDLGGDEPAADVKVAASATKAADKQKAKTAPVEGTPVGEISDDVASVLQEWD